MLELLKLLKLLKLLELLQLLHCLLLHAHPSFHGVKGSLALLHVRLGLEARFSFERVWRPIIGSWRHLCSRRSVDSITLSHTHAAISTGGTCAR